MAERYQIPVALVVVKMVGLHDALCVTVAPLRVILNAQRHSVLKRATNRVEDPQVGSSEWAESKVKPGSWYVRSTVIDFVSEEQIFSNAL